MFSIGRVQNRRVVPDRDIFHRRHQRFLPYTFTKSLPYNSYNGSFYYALSVSIASIGEQDPRRFIRANNRCLPRTQTNHLHISRQEIADDLPSQRFGFGGQRELRVFKMHRFHGRLVGLAYQDARIVSRLLQNLEEHVRYNLGSIVSSF